MILKLSSLALLTTLSAAAIAQTPTPARKPVTHRPTTSTAAPKAAEKSAAAATPAAAVVNPADTPPNVPKVEGTAKPLYALRYIDTVIGTGPLSEPRKYYTVHYTGWLTDGTKFDSSVDRGSPITFPYGARQVIAGWDTGFEGMHVGGKRRLFIPYQLAYGEMGRAPIPPKADLIFDIELVDMSDAPPQPKTAPPPNPETKPATDPAAKPGTDEAPKTPPHPEGR